MREGLIYKSSVSFNSMTAEGSIPGGRGRKGQQNKKSTASHRQRLMFVHAEEGEEEGGAKELVMPDLMVPLMEESWQGLR